MNFLDKIAFNRLVSIIANFILSIMKLLNVKGVDNIEIDTKPDRRRIFPIFKRKKNETK
jgi:hypothetical protein